MNCFWPHLWCYSRTSKKALILHNSTEMFCQEVELLKLLKSAPSKTAATARMCRGHTSCSEWASCHHPPLCYFALFRPNWNDFINTSVFCDVKRQISCSGFDTLSRPKYCLCLYVWLYVYLYIYTHTYILPGPGLAACRDRSAESTLSICQQLTGSHWWRHWSSLHRCLHCKKWPC